MSSFGLIFKDGALCGFKTPEHDVHKKQYQQREEAKKSDRESILNARRCLEAWQRWALSSGGYGDSSLSMLGKIRGGVVDHSPILGDLNGAGSLAMTALSEMERVGGNQSRYAKMIKGVYLYQVKGEKPIDTLKKLGFEVSYKQYSIAELNIARMIEKMSRRLYEQRLNR